MENTSIVIKEWVELYTSEMLAWAIYKTSDQQTAEDLVQETFLAAFQTYSTFENKSKPKTWLFGILKNKITAIRLKYFPNKHFLEIYKRRIYNL